MKTQSRAKPKLVTVRGVKKKVFLSEYKKDLMLLNRGIISESTMKEKYGYRVKKTA